MRGALGTRLLEAAHAVHAVHAWVAHAARGAQGGGARRGNVGLGVRVGAAFRTG